MDRSQLTGRKHHLPDMVLRTESGEAPLRRAGRSLLILLVDDSACEACAGYLELLSGSSEEITSWGSDIAVVVAAEQGGGPALPSVFRTFYDPEGKLASVLGTVAPGVVIVDEWGEVTVTHSAGREHNFPPVADLVAEIRYLGTRCPECEGETL